MYNYQKPSQKKPKSNTPVDLLNLYVEGVAKDKLRKIEMRKDAMMLLRVKQKYDIISQHFAKFKGANNNSNIPNIKLQNGKNLLLEAPEFMGQYSEIYDIFLEELANFNIDFFSYLPNLMRLSIRFSNISLIPEREFISVRRFPSLVELKLNCNNLDSSCLEIIRNIKNLKILNLMGNFITADIPDISKLEYLEELDLSYNNIESYFINLNMLKDLKLDREHGFDNIEQGQMQNQQYNDRELNEKHFENTQNTFEKLQVYLKTNMQDFYHKISQLKRLKSLNISNNRIFFFDTDPAYIKNNKGFPNLRRIDMSNNLIEEEIGLLLVVGVPHLEFLDVTNNPITRYKDKFENIEYEIFKSKNILLTNNTEFKKLKSRYTINDILNFPPQPYLVKKFKLEQKGKKDLITYVKPESLDEEDKKEEGENENEIENEVEKNTSEIELPPIGKLNVNPILLTKLDMAGKRKKAVKTGIQKDIFYKTPI